MVEVGGNAKWSISDTLENSFEVYYNNILHKHMVNIYLLHNLKSTHIFPKELKTCLYTHMQISMPVIVIIVKIRNITNVHQFINEYKCVIGPYHGIIFSNERIQWLPT